MKPSGHQDTGVGAPGIEAWLRCPRCGSEDVTVHVLAHEVYVACEDCGVRTSKRVPS
ncbi:MAG: hypothetical protein ABEJ08_05655 [Halobacteriaceae archaeon]